MIKRNPKIIFQKLGVENFGPFHKYREIDFSTGPDKNVTLIEGDIGSGKTSLFQLFWWVLFPESNEKKKKTEMKYLRSEESVDVVNTMAIKNANIGDEISVKGVIQFSRKSGSGHAVIYTVNRVRSYKKMKEITDINGKNLNEEEILEYIPDSDKLTVLKGSNPVDNTRFLKLIEINFPRAIRKFSFIHGEGMTRILSIKNVGKLKQSALELSDYPKIKGLKYYLSECLNHFNGKEKECLKDDIILKDKKIIIENETLALKAFQKKITDKENLFEKYHNRIVDIESELSELKKNQKAVEEYHDLKTKLSDKKKLRNGYAPQKRKRIPGLLEEREKTIMKYAPLIYLEDKIEICLKDIQKKHEMGIIPGESIPKRYLEIILSRTNDCVCHTKWTEDMKKSINEEMKQSIDEILIENINDFDRWLKDQVEHIKEGKSEISEVENKLLVLNDEIEDISGKLRKIERSLSKEEKTEDFIKKINKLNDEKTDLIGKKARIQQKISDLDNLKKDQSDLIRQLKIDLKKLETERSTSTTGYNAIYYRNICENLEKLEEMRSKIIKTIGDSIRNEVQSETKNILGQLVRDSSKWENITIEETLSGWVINAVLSGNSITNISTGMTNVLGLAFIFALSYILDVDLPLIFDSPFGNLDSVTRELVSENLPPIFKGRQIIFFEKEANLRGKKDSEGNIKDLYPILKKFIDYEYRINNPDLINADIKKIS